MVQNTDEVVVRDLRRSTTELQRDTLGLRWWESNPRPPAYEACTPSRQSVCFHWPGDEVVVRRIALPLSYTHHRINRVGDRTRTDNRCTPTGSRRGQSHFSKETANEENGSDATLKRCSPNRQLAVRDAGGNRTHFDRVAAGCLAIWLQRQVSSSGVEPDPRPSQGRVRSATPRGQKHPGPDSNRDPDFRRV